LGHISGEITVQTLENIHNRFSESYGICQNRTMLILEKWQSDFLGAALNHENEVLMWTQAAVQK